MYKIIFVCLGNICRSPSGEGVFTQLVQEKGLSESFVIDSAGTAAYHTGERADGRMRKHALKRGIKLNSRARQFVTSDFQDFDLVVCMDRSNYHNIKALDYNNQYSNKIVMMTDYARTMKYKEVPDPYYGGAEGFEIVLDILEDACSGLLEELLKNARS